MITERRNILEGQFAIGHIPANLSHPQPIGDGRDASNLHLARRQLDKEENKEALQPSAGPHFHGEEIRARASLFSTEMWF
jgi:hypothetical protein